MAAQMEGSMSFVKPKSPVITALLVILGILIPLALIPPRGWREFSRRDYSTVLKDRQGRELRVIPLDDGLRRIYVDLREIPEPVIQMVLDSEDQRYYWHGGVDGLALVRAFFLNVSEQGIQSGGSTIAMQLARIIRPRAPGYRGKIQELLYALKLDQYLSKRRILELYMSNLPFGRNLEGLEAASRYYLGKEASQLNGAETLVLMMIPRSPSLYDPIREGDANLQACLRTLPRLQNPVSEEEIRHVLQDIKANAPHVWLNRAPHFTLWIEEQLRDAPQGYSILQTTLDLEYQEALEYAIAYYQDTARGNRISNGSGLIMDNSTGGVLAYSGSVDFYDLENSGQIDGVQMLRQPGSTLKPFLYAQGLEMGISPVEILPDIPLEFGEAQIYIPENYNQRFNGPVLFPISLASSLNVPAVYLLERLGVQNFVDKLILCGFESLEDQRPYMGLGLALGNGEVSLFELVQAYGLFSNGGVFIPLNAWDSMERPEEHRVYSEETAEQIRSVLSNPLNRILGFGRSSILDRDYDVFFKTGTSNQFNNIWAIGATQDITCGVWMGNFSGETVVGAPGSSIPARAVVAVLDEMHRVDHFVLSCEMCRTRICALSGMEPGPHCSSTLEVDFSNVPSLEPCSWHSSTGIHYPAEFDSWYRDSSKENLVAPNEGSGVIEEPRNGSVFYYDRTLPESSQRIFVHLGGFESAQLFHNERLIFQGDLPAKVYLPLQEGQQRLLLISSDGVRQEVEFQVYRSSGNSTQEPFSIEHSNPSMTF